MNVLVVYGSRHGGTRGIAERITQVLRAEGLMADVAPAGEATEVAHADAFVIGSGVYMGSWLKDAIEFIERNQETLAGRPVWLFSSGPLPGSSRGKERPIRSPTHSARRAAPAAAAGRRSSSSAPPSIPATTASSTERSIRTTRLERCRSDSSG